MIIDCDTCEVRGAACTDCVIGVLLGAPGSGSGGAGPSGTDSDEPAPDGPPPGAPIVQLDAPERRALEVLADQGLVPKLRLVARPARRTTGPADAEPHVRDVG
jgi:hypothetical protein